LGLFDYCLHHLDDESSTVNPPSDLIQLVHQFIVTSVISYPNEVMQTAAIKGALTQIVSVPLNWEVLQGWFGIQPDAIDSGDTPFFVVEVKNELGLGGDASLQAALSYVHIATSPVDKV